MTRKGTSARVLRENKYDFNCPLKSQTELPCSIWQTAPDNNIEKLIFEFPLDKALNVPFLPFLRNVIEFYWFFCIRSDISLN